MSSTTSALSPADFVSANADINHYLERQPGFRRRRIAVRSA